MAFSLDSGGMEDLAGEIAAMAHDVPAAIEQALTAEIPLLELEANVAVASVTPVDTGQLRDSTQTNATVAGMILSGAIRQTRTVQGASHAFVLARLLIDGHRIVNQGGDTGRTTAPNPYPDQADPALLTAADRISSRLGADALLFLQRAR